HGVEPLSVPRLETCDIRFAQGVTQRPTRLVGALFAAVPAHEIQAEDFGRELHLGTGWDAIGTDDRAPTVALRVVEGGGRLIVVGTVTPFISSGLALADNALFATDLALSGGGSVAFDEYDHGVHPAASLLAGVERTWPGRALLFVMVVAFAFVVLTGRRLG